MQPGSRTVVKRWCASCSDEVLTHMSKTVGGFMTPSALQKLSKNSEVFELLREWWAQTQQRQRTVAFGGQ